MLFQFVPNTAEADKYPLHPHTFLAECRDVNDSNRSKTAVFAEAYSAKVRANVQIRYCAHGYELAGSCCRWTDGYYSVRWMQGGAFQGRRYSLTKAGLSDAWAHYESLTATES